MTCNICNQQYVGETTTRLSVRMNGHRSSTTGCLHIINHKKSCSGSIFSIQILEKLVGNGYGDNNKPDPELTNLRQTREDYWIKCLRTLYPYGLNEKAFDKFGNATTIDHAIGRLFPPLQRNGIRPTRTRKPNNTQTNVISAKSFFEHIHELISNDLKATFNKIRIILNNLSKSILKNIASEIIEPSIFEFKTEYEQIYIYIADIIDTKFVNKIDPIPSKKKIPPSNVCVIQFINKGIDDIHLSKIFKSEDVINNLPTILQEENNIPIATFKLDNPIRNKILNYKDTISSLSFKQVNNDKVEIENLPECNCTDSQFCDPAHGHIVTGNLNIIENNKLRKLLSKGPNFREPKTLNYNKCFSSIEADLQNTVDHLTCKYNLANNALEAWREAILAKVRNRIIHLKKKKTPQQSKPALKDPQILQYLNIIHNNYVLVPIDKASNNIAIVCKRFYIERTMKELGLLDTISETYKISNTNPSEIINDNITLCKKFGLTITEKHHSLPFMFWTPKMHKNPTGARFIVASAMCSTKPISNVISIIFSKIFQQINNFNSKCLFYNNYNRFWVIQNSKTLINRLKELNKKCNAKNISTFDFSTLYTKLPHADLILVLNELIDLVFNGGRKTASGNRKFLTVLGKQCFFSRLKHGDNSFTKNEVKMLVKHLISETFFQVGNKLFRQCIGIPMGIDPAPFWANLYLYFYENKYITGLIKSKNQNERFRGFKFKNCFRFIDDCCSINDNYAFNQYHSDIYPIELELKCEHLGNHATFLELDIEIVDNTFVYKLFDKRDSFPFSIVRMPDLNGNIPSHVFYGSIFSEFLRIARATLRYDDFLPKARELIERMIKQGADLQTLLRQFNKLIERHPDAFETFNVDSATVKSDLSDH